MAAKRASVIMVGMKRVTARKGKSFQSDPLTKSIVKVRSDRSPDATISIFILFSAVRYQTEACYFPKAFRSM